MLSSSDPSHPTQNQNTLRLTEREHAVRIFSTLWSATLASLLLVKNAIIEGIKEYRHLLFQQTEYEKETDKQPRFYPRDC